ncbi:hypothetical protein BRD17_05185 [Halobacteriales archaeon SW_7_68_16]|nr:MAG: hypothetical protein BRD17_05185 [Halobacteriales archaeon SW_7_68_16]
MDPAGQIIRRLDAQTEVSLDGRVANPEMEVNPGLVVRVRDVERIEGHPESVTLVGSRRSDPCRPDDCDVQVAVDRLGPGEFDPRWSLAVDLPAVDQPVAVRVCDPRVGTQFQLPRIAHAVVVAVCDEVGTVDGSEQTGGEGGTGSGDDDHHRDADDRERDDLAGESLVGEPPQDSIRRVRRGDAVVESLRVGLSTADRRGLDRSLALAVDTVDLPLVVRVDRRPALPTSFHLSRAPGLNRVMTCNPAEKSVPAVAVVPRYDMRRTIPQDILLGGLD